MSEYPVKITLEFTEKEVNGNLWYIIYKFEGSYTDRIEVTTLILKQYLEMLT